MTGGCLLESSETQGRSVKSEKTNGDEGFHWTKTAPWMLLSLVANQFHDSFMIKCLSPIGVQHLYCAAFVIFSESVFTHVLIIYVNLLK